MKFLGYMLANALRQYGEIIIYGAGWFATQLYPVLCKNGLKEKIICFSVSEMGEERQFEEFEIKEIQNVQCDKERTAVLIAVSERYQDEIAAKVRMAGFNNIFLPKDYIWSDENMVKLYHGLSYNEFIEGICRSHICDCQEEEDLCHSMKERLLARQNRNDFDHRQIVYISGHLSPRNAKMINALRKKDYNIIAILYGYIQTAFLDELQSQDISFLECSNEEEVMFQALKYRPLVYFYEPVWGNCIWLQMVLQYKQHFRPIVVGLYDVMNDGYVVNSLLLESEKYVLENADGVVWRWFSKEYLEERKLFLYKGKSIQFHDFCGGYIKENKDSIQEKCILRLCSVQGSFWDFSQDGDVPEGYETFASLKDITNILGNIDSCILHIYISRYEKKGFDESKKIEDKFSNIRFFWNVNHMDLIDKLQDYDYGCEFYNSGKMIPLDMPVQCGTNRYYGSINVNSVSNRFFDYIDAGLPIVTIMPHKQVDFLSKYGIIVHMSVQDFDIDYLKENVLQFKSKVAVARKKLDIDYHIDYLIKFFREL